MNFGPIPFEVPMEYLARIDAGELVRYGTILKDVSDGRIVAHLQQTGAFDHVLGYAFSGVQQAAQTVSSPVGALTGIATTIQSQKMGKQLDGLTDMVGNLQTLSLVGSVASVAGIGVTVASTAILMRQIKMVDTGIQRLSDELADIKSHLREVDIHRALHRVGDTMEKLAEAPFRKTAAGTEKVLYDVEENLRSGFNELLEGVQVAISMDVVDAELLRTLLAGIATCSGAQTKTLVWLDEIKLAQTRAQTHAVKLNQLARLMATDVMQVKLAGEADAATQVGLDLRELRAVMSSRPSFLARIEDLQISGPTYLAQTEERDDAPVLFLASG